ncbi:MAG: formylglycine-generating enzyme family protein [Cyanophyceae cyanobacterium]
MTNAPASSGLMLHRYRRRNKCLHEQLAEGVTLTLMLIPAGEFLMGAPESEPESSGSERSQHRVKLESFLLGRYPVTQAQWRVVAGYPLVERELERNPSTFKGENRPVEQVSWEDAKEFCRRLSAKTGRSYRLPSEAEWEYACRAETETPFHYGEMITAELASYDTTKTYNGSLEGKYRGGMMDVGSFPANRWGLHDMHGNLWEWCEDDWHDSYEGAPVDGRAWLGAGGTQTNKLLRGGAWNSAPWYCRSAYRRSDPRYYRYGNIGFRVCCEVPRILHFSP